MQVGTGFPAGRGWTTDCPTAAPVLVTGGPGAFSTFVVDAYLPHHFPSAASWSDIDTPDDSADGAGTWIAVSTYGGGVWRGELSW